MGLIFFMMMIELEFEEFDYILMFFLLRNMVIFCIIFKYNMILVK